MRARGGALFIQRIASMSLENDDKSAYSITGTFDTQIYERETANSVGWFPAGSRNEMLCRGTLDLVSSLLLLLVGPCPVFYPVCLSYRDINI